MLTFEDMPEDNAELAKIVVDFPHLDPNTADSCPEPMSQILSYLETEAPGGESLDESDLNFLRTAQVADHQYWIWSFTDSDGAACYVTVVSIPRRPKIFGRTRILGYDDNHYGLTPEQ